MPGRYESRFLSAIDPAEPRGLWIRHTSRQRPGAAATGALWCTLFEPAPTAVKSSLPAPPGGFGAARVEGRAQAGGHAAAWALDLAGEAPPLRHLSPAWLYRAPLPRTKLEAPRPDVVVTGTLEMDGRRLEVAGWRGTVGHNWGAEHAERWAWVHTWLDGAWLELALARVRVGGRLLPWVANGALALDGDRIRLGGLARRRGLAVRVAPGALDATVPGAGARVALAVRAEPAHTVALEYAGVGAEPDRREVLHTTAAEVHLRVERRGRPALELAAAHGAAYELGSPDSGHGVPLQRYPDP